jgi:hypothetical protein
MCFRVKSVLQLHIMNLKYGLLQEKIVKFPSLEIV